MQKKTTLKQVCTKISPSVKLLLCKFDRLYMVCRFPSPRLFILSFLVSQISTKIRFFAASYFCLLPLYIHQYPLCSYIVFPCILCLNILILIRVRFLYLFPFGQFQSAWHNFRTRFSDIIISNLVNRYFGGDIQDIFKFLFSAKGSNMAWFHFFIYMCYMKV